jgi:hypothetical protein
MPFLSLRGLDLWGVGVFLRLPARNECPFTWITQRITTTSKRLLPSTIIKRHEGFLGGSTIDRMGSMGAIAVEIATAVTKR